MLMSLSSFISPKKKKKNVFVDLLFSTPSQVHDPEDERLQRAKGKGQATNLLISRFYRAVIVGFVEIEFWIGGFFFRKWLSGYEISREVNSLLNSFRQLRSVSTFCVGGTLVDINAFHKCQLWLSRGGTRQYWVNHTLIPLIQLRRISQPACDQMSKRSSSYFFLLRLSPELARTFAK